MGSRRFLVGLITMRKIVRRCVTYAEKILVLQVPIQLFKHFNNLNNNGLAMVATSWKLQKQLHISIGIL